MKNTRDTTTPRPPESVTFFVGLPPVALRRNSQTANHNYRAALVRAYQEQVWCAGQSMAFEESYNGVKQTTITCPYLPPWERVSLALTWRHHRQAPDIDNAIAACKSLIDCCHTKGARPLGIFIDDTPVGLESVSLTTEKVASKGLEGVVVTITRKETP